MEQSISSEIGQIRARLTEIRHERESLATGADGDEAQLLEEEHGLERRLTELTDNASSERAGEAERIAAEQTDVTRAPELPDDPADKSRRDTPES